MIFYLPSLNPSHSRARAAASISSATSHQRAELGEAMSIPDLGFRARQALRQNRVQAAGGRRAGILSFAIV